ncbi:uncharacterized protein At1g65710-like isoform X2 [Chenopodium quinoa]|uniref:uncharacterized protein At1g65710-like isoform X2 n=1 Tax=Chenopodium quinoa TaxID=63459 RepID=UPI000B771EF7|nr:uncharacterized protein At1g65710-like isoform X2 [Chenopodium quinoa]
MGCCLSKNDPCSNSHSQIEQTDTKKKLPVPVPVPITVKLEHPKKQLAGFEAAAPKPECSTKEIESETKEVFTKKKKEVFVIQHRKSNDNRPETDGSASNSSNSSDPSRGSGSEEIGRNILAAAANGQAVRTSSCTKEEVDAILIQCGRLSRSSSGKGNGNGNGNGNGHGRRYSGSKRSFDFDRENDTIEDSKRNGNEDELNDDDERSRRRQSRGSNRRRSTPSRSRERDQQQLRSGSKERSQSNGRRVSRSPGRRSESPITQTHNGNGNGNGNGTVRPGKLVSVPATVTSLSVEKGSVGNGNDGNVKRVLVKRNVGSPRSQSPARAISPARASSPVRGGNQGNGGGQQQPVSAPLSRNGSRKAEHSPFRRTPLNEIDINSLPFHPLSNKRPVSKGKEIEEDVVLVKQPINSGFQNKYAETNNVKASIQGTHRRSRSRGAEGYEVTKTNYCRVNELQTPNVEQLIEDKRGQLDTVEYDAMVTPVVVSGAETLKLPQTLMRSRSARRSRDLDISVEALLAPTPATDYNSLLLRDIQNFHQKKNSNTNANTNATANANVSSSNNAGSSNMEASNSYKLPPCVSKACSIVEAVADLNSMTGSDDRRKSPKETNFSFNSSKKVLESKDPFVESEVKVSDDLMEPSLHKYVTVRMKGGDFNDEESSGSNSYVGGSQQNWLSSSTWEPTSADSTESWTSKSYSREELNPARFQRHATSEIACGINEEPEKKYSNGGATRVRTIASRAPTASASKAAVASM